MKFQSKKIYNHCLDHTVKQNKHTKHLIEAGKQINAKKRCLIIEREFAEDEEIKKTCTFIPKITSKAKSKYLESSQHKPQVIINSECTFQPTINTRSGLIIRKDYSHNSNKDPFERLYTKIQSKKCLDIPKQPTTSKVKMDLKQFLARQEFCEVLRKHTLELAKNDVITQSSPKINENSKKIAASLGKFDTRMKLVQLKVVKTEGINWFHPKINNKINYNLHLRSLPKNKENTNNEVTEVKYSKSKLYDSVQSKLKLKSNIDTLMTRIESDKVKKERSNYQEKLVKEIGEELEHSYKPKIHPMPKYLNRSKDHSDKQTIKNSYSKH